MLPFASHSFDTGTGRLHYVDEGQGPPVLLLHGNPTSSFMYRKLVAALAPAFRCIAPDYLGFGRSDKPADWSYLPRDHAACIGRLVDALGLDDLTLVVHDWGGPIGCAVALARPGRVRRLVVCNSFCWPLQGDPVVELFSRVVGGPPGRFAVERWNVLARFGLYAGFGRPERLSPEAHRVYVEATSAPHERRGQWIFARELLGSAPWLEELWRSRERLAGLDAFIAWGLRDPALRRNQLERWRALLPQAPVLRLETTGHFAAEEAGGELARHVSRWLGGS